MRRESVDSHDRAQSCVIVLYLGVLALVSTPTGGRCQRSRYPFAGSVAPSLSLLIQQPGLHLRAEKSRHTELSSLPEFVWGVA